MIRPPPSGAWKIGIGGTGTHLDSGFGRADPLRGRRGANRRKAADNPCDPHSSDAVGAVRSSRGPRRPMSTVMTSVASSIVASADMNSAISVAVAKKAMQASRIEGAGAVALVKSAAEAADTGDRTRRPTGGFNGVGGNLDLYG